MDPWSTARSADPELKAGPVALLLPLGRGLVALQAGEGLALLATDAMNPATGRSLRCSPGGAESAAQR